MRRILVLALLCYYVTGLLGCACLKEGARGFLGVSTREIENARGEAIVKIVDYGYRSCYRKEEEALAGIGSYIYLKRKTGRTKK